MRAEELMIGNWVIAETLHQSYPYREIRQIKYSDYTWEESLEYPQVEFHPLPLTRKILNDNGFVDSYINESLDRSEIYTWGDVYGNLVIVDMISNKIKVKHDSRTLLDLWYTEKVPVHELQLALKHCGIKKEITL